MTTAELRALLLKADPEGKSRVVVKDEITLEVTGVWRSRSTGVLELTTQYRYEDNDP